MRSALATIAACLLATTTSFAQTTAPPSTPPTPAPATTSPPSTTAKLEPGANSFTEGQARARFQEAGLTDVSDLRKDDQGIWRAKGKKDGRDVSAGLDFKGNLNIQ